jgi:hypothetical protein
MQHSKDSFDEGRLHMLMTASGLVSSARHEALHHLHACSEVLIYLEKALEQAAPQRRDVKTVIDELASHLNHVDHSLGLVWKALRHPRHHREIAQLDEICRQAFDMVRET